VLWHYKKTMEQNAGTKQLSQGANRAETHIHGIYESASSIARRVLESMQALAGTTSCKGVQISELEKWAKENKCWIEALYGEKFLKSLVKAK
jgi:hypothetical protein